jgi:hypothetical protein
MRQILAEIEQGANGKTPDFLTQYSALTDLAELLVKSK